MAVNDIEIYLKKKETKSISKVVNDIEMNDIKMKSKS